MAIFVVTSAYFFGNNTLGTYSTIKRARAALETFLNEDDNIFAFEDIGDYCYQFLTLKNETFIAEITYTILDEEFVNGSIKED